jgi:hypothetical protein
MSEGPVHEVDNKRYFVKTPWHTDVLHSPEGKFPDITPKGVEMSSEERLEAKAAAKQAHIKLAYKEVSE